jgi:hypothetical protein
MLVAVPDGPEHGLLIFGLDCSMALTQNLTPWLSLQITRIQV